MKKIKKIKSRKKIKIRKYNKKILFNIKRQKKKNIIIKAIYLF